MYVMIVLQQVVKYKQKYIYFFTKGQTIFKFLHDILFHEIYQVECVYII